MDGDAKSCFDAIKEGCSTVAWSIQWFQYMICDVVDSDKFFVSCNFNSIRREFNSATHCLAKFAVIHRSSVCGNSHILLAAVLDACRNDAAFV